jgi:hypothetical protein
MNIVLTYTHFGIFDREKFWPHVNATQTWAFDPRVGRFVKIAHSVAPSETVRQQVSVAEGFLRAGDIERAREAYATASTDQNLKGEGEEPVWRGYARFREGEMLALLGRDSEAKSALNEVAKLDALWGDLARAFLKNYVGEDGAIRAWAGVLREVDLYEFVSQGARNLWKLDAREVFFEGEIVAAYLNAHPESARSPAQVFDQIARLGWKPLESLTDDLDGNGVPEFVFVTDVEWKRDRYQILWLVTKGAHGWIARKVNSYFFNKTWTLSSATLPDGKGRAIIYPDERGEFAFTWDGAQIIVLKAATLKPFRDDMPDWPRVGSGAD